jgi:hypothetical protein
MSFNWSRFRDGFLGAAGFATPIGAGIVYLSNQPSSAASGMTPVDAGVISWIVVTVCTVIGAIWAAMGE